MYRENSAKASTVAAKLRKKLKYSITKDSDAMPSTAVKDLNSRLSDVTRRIIDDSAMDRQPIFFFGGHWPSRLL